MRTTVRLDPGLLDRAREVADERGETLTSLIERGLRLVLARGDGGPTRRRVRLPVSRATGGTLPGVDLDDAANLLDVLDETR
jgi:hypothetical protein